MRPSRATLAVLLLLGLAAACAAPGPATPRPSPTFVVDPFAGGGWILVGLDGRTPLAGTTITLGFVGGQLRGSAGCNDYGGPFTGTANGVLAAPTIVAGARGCPATLPEGAGEQERRYLETLQAVRTYHRDGARLSLATGDGRELVFTQRE